MKNNSARNNAVDKFVEAKLRSGLNPGGTSCLEPEILAAYVERTLTSRERANCELHVASCARCQEQVATLVRLSEADEASVIQTKTARSAPAAGFNWFRWAWAGPALAAMLVMAIYFRGPFRNDIKQMPGPEIKIQNPVAPKSANSPAAPEVTTNGERQPVASGSAHGPKGQRAENKTLDMERRAGATAGRPGGPQTESPRATVQDWITAPKEPAIRVQNQVVEQAQQSTTPAAPAPPASAANQVAPARQGDMATPSVRADLAKKDERRQSAGGGGSTPSGAVGGIISRTPSNNSSASGSSGNLAAVGRNGKAVSPQPATNTSNEKTRPSKAALYDDGKAKKEEQKSDTDSAVLRENERDKQQTTQSVSVSSAPEQLMVTSEVAAPQWRVGRHGRIQKLDAKGKWKKQRSGVHADLFAVAFSSPDAGWAVGQGGAILRTTDGGATWNQLPSPTTEDLVQIKAASEQAATMVTRGGQSFTTTNGGATWNSVGR
ncbi:MAG TPA: YCF48-related protein [Terriglobia bacterium]|nr:YCF48-related protein [Terriglobia bacterium]